MDNYYKIKYDKYVSKLDDTSSVKYHFNSYGFSIPTRYSMLLNTLSLSRANDNQYQNIKKNIINLTKDSYSWYKLVVGSQNMIITLYNNNELLTFFITPNNLCYIEIFYGSSPVLLNILKNICYENNIYTITTFSINQAETDFLQQNGFILKNKVLVFLLI
jgi:hypothetical protein